MYSYTEENYLKAIYSLTSRGNEGASTNAIAERLETKASSVSDMIRKLAGKGLVHYKKYQGTTLTKAGQEAAIHLIRKHRLWETFLVEKLGFKWDEVHELAEELEHIRSQRLTDRLDQFLGEPKYDPHGDPIPDKDGNIEKRRQVLLNQLQPEDKAVVVGVKDSSSSFLKYLEKVELVLGTGFEVKEQFEFDGSLVLETDQGRKLTTSEQVNANLFVRKL